MSSVTFAASNMPHAGIACGGGTAGAQGAVEGHASASGGEAAAAGGAETAGQGEGAGAGDVLLATDPQPGESYSIHQVSILQGNKCNISAL